MMADVTAAARQQKVRAKTTLASDPFFAFLPNTIDRVRAYDREEPTQAEILRKGRRDEVRAKLSALEEESKQLSRLNQERDGKLNVSEQDRWAQINIDLRALGKDVTDANIELTRATEAGGTVRVGEAKRRWLEVRNSAVALAVAFLADVTTALATPGARELNHPATLASSRLAGYLASLGAELELDAPKASAAIELDIATVRLARDVATMLATLLAEFQAWSIAYTKPASGLKWHHWTAGTPCIATLAAISLILSGGAPTDMGRPSRVAEEGWKAWEASLR
jgi:hypothetical protein